jgi:hypothetical protein
MDFDPRDLDSRDDERHRGSDVDVHDHHADGLDSPSSHGRDRDDDAQTLSRGPGDAKSSNNGGSDLRSDARWAERDRSAPERSVDPRDPFTRHVDLPRGPEREIVRDRGRQYTLRGSETRTLATVGAFRVVFSRDLRDHRDRPLPAVAR